MPIFQHASLRRIKNLQFTQLLFVFIKKLNNYSIHILSLIHPLKNNMQRLKKAYLVAILLRSEI